MGVVAATCVQKYEALHGFPPAEITLKRVPRMLFLGQASERDSFLKLLVTYGAWRTEMRKLRGKTLLEKEQRLEAFLNEKKIKTP